MGSRGKQNLAEDIPLINDPSAALIAPLKRSPGSTTTRPASFQGYYSDSVQKSIKRKPVPPRDPRSDYIQQAHLPDHLDYSTIPDNEDGSHAYHVDHTDVKVSSAESAVIWLDKPVTSSNQAEDPKWLPYALRLPWLLGLILFKVLVVVVVSVLHYESYKHNGLATDSGSPGLYFAWRFMPTLVAVSYVTMLMIVLDAVKHTEPFARMVRVGGATVESSISRKPGAWWTAFIDSFPRKQNGGHFSIAMLLAATIYILGLFVVSPFSSALLQIKEVSISAATPFDTIQLDNNTPLSFQPKTLDIAQTMAHALQNVTTSPWIKGGYSIIPFWPSQEGHPDGARINSANSWEVDATVLSSVVDYEVLQLTGSTSSLNWPYTTRAYNGSMVQDSTNLNSLIFKTSTGCEYGFAYSPRTVYLPQGGLSWSSLSNITLPGFWEINSYFGNGDQLVLLNHTIQCEPGEVLTILPPPGATWQPQSYLFRPSYYSATLPVTVTPTSDATIIRFDEHVFNKTRKPIAANFINTTSFSDVFLTLPWNNFVVDPDTGGAYYTVSDKRTEAGGPATILAASYDFRLSALIQDPAFVTNAIQIRQQFFGRLVQTSLQNITKTRALTGSARRSERRIVVTTAVAIVLESVLAAILCLFSVFVWFTRLSKRPLGVAQDTAFANTIASLMSLTQRTTAPMDIISSVHMLNMEQGQSVVICKLQDDKLVTIPTDYMILESREMKTPSGSNSNTIEQSPNVLTGWKVSLLALFLCILIAVIAVLYWYSITHGLSQRAFTYQMTIDSNAHSFGTIAPYSIIPTLLGVLSGLWWDSIESVFRTVQPYIAMTRRPTSSARGSGLSYQSSYLVWAGLRSLSRGHWLLALVCTGAFLSQIFTIIMSALWQPVSSNTKSNRILNQPFQLREVPFLYVASDYRQTPAQQILPSIFRNITANWLYGAFSQLTVNASEPVWSQDGWSFVPVSFDNLNSAQKTTGLPVGYADATATVTVPGIHGRLECVPVAQDLDSRYYTTLVNISGWNATTKPLPPADAYYVLGCSESYVNFDPNTTDAEYNCSYDQSMTGLLAAAVPLSCCGWDANGLPENGIFSYWSQIFGKNDSGFSTPSGLDIAVKTMYGPSPAFYDNGQVLGNTVDLVSTLVWPTPPDLAMLRCTAIVETASFSVTVNIATKQVQNSTMLDKPTPYTAAWTDNYLQHERPLGIDPSSMESSAFVNNYTVSFGRMFLSALMGAGQLYQLGGCGDTAAGVSCIERSDDQTFNYHAPGMNMDYMSYSMLALASNNISAILDHARMIPLAQKVFTTFFQHFVSNNVPTDGTGGWAFQRANETLPEDLLPPYGQNSNPNARVAQTASPTVAAIISEPIEKLQMSPVAVYLCLAILTWLLITTVLILLSKERYFSPLLQPIETVADVAHLVVHSDCYLELARKKGATGLRRDKNFRTKLGWFRSRADGQPRWGIELSDDSRVEWLDDEEIKRLRSASREKG